MRSLQADEIVAAVDGGAEHDAVAGRTQRVDGVDQQRRRERRAVAVDEARAVVTRGDQILRRV